MLSIGNGQNKLEFTALDGLLYYEKDLNTGASVNHLYLGRQKLVDVESNGTATYFHNDPTGSPLAATNATGGVIWRANYKPFGDKTFGAGAQTPIKNQQWFTGKPHEEATGLSYFGARWYDPVLGRFTAIDPVDWNEANPIHSFNRYAYANNNPFKFVDPDGRESQESNAQGNTEQNSSTKTENHSNVISGLISGIKATRDGLFGKKVGTLSVGYSVTIQMPLNLLMLGLYGNTGFNFSLTTNCQFVSSLGYTYGPGVGFFAGVGDSLGVSVQDPGPSGLTKSQAIQAEANAGLVATAGVAVQTSGKDAAISKGSKITGKYSAGAGIMGGVGINNGWSYASKEFCK